MGDGTDVRGVAPSLCADSLMHVRKWSLSSNFLLLTVLSIVFWVCAKRLHNPAAWQKVISGLSSFELLLGVGIVDVLLLGVALVFIPFADARSIYSKASKPMELLANAAIAFISLALVSGAFQCRADWSVAASTVLALIILLFSLAGAGLLRQAASLQWNRSGPWIRDVIVYGGVTLAALGFIVWAFSYPWLVESLPARIQALAKLPFLLNFSCPWN
ncbi:hypothetical protein [Stenotrophomonas indicatrix]|uniref:hypothetical protein n=1 Tax=Stenotrophomonas indicatrix TaxID=2045451 RepID=UPI000FD89493|nr:hypothetical protein [Stenotrophomonas indicatrix]